MSNLHTVLNLFESALFALLAQRFFVNEQHWEEPHGPVFLYIGGETPISEVDVLTGMTQANPYLLSHSSR